MSDINLDEMAFDFFEEEEEIELKPQYKILVADDDQEVHAITEMALSTFEFEGFGLNILHAYSGQETRELMAEHEDVAILILDVVMEDNNSGLDVVDYLRHKLKNTMTRIILRTGQPGEAPKESVIKTYEINDYLLKTELTIQKLYAALWTGLRSYRDLKKLEAHKVGLEKIIETSAKLFNHHTFGEFLNSILMEMSHFYKNSPGLMYVSAKKEMNQSGFVSIGQQSKVVIVAATGKYEPYIGQEIEQVEGLEGISEMMLDSKEGDENIQFIKDGFLIRGGGHEQLDNFIFIEGDNSCYDFDLINLFLKNYAMALDNFILKNTLSTTQKEMIFAITEAIEINFIEPSDHVRRLSQMMFNFAHRAGYAYAECEILKVASLLHDVGKMRLPQDLLLKAGSLTEEEYDQVKQHTILGHKMLSKSPSDVLQVAAELALNHHERYDGQGYPYKKSGMLIPKSARMMAILDVFDAMTHAKVYGQVKTVDQAKAYLIDQRGKHFDSGLVDIFIEHLDEIINKG